MELQAHLVMVAMVKMENIKVVLYMAVVLAEKLGNKEMLGQ